MYAVFLPVATMLEVLNIEIFIFFTHIISLEIQENFISSENFTLAFFHSPFSPFAHLDLNPSFPDLPLGISLLGC